MMIMRKILSLLSLGLYSLRNEGIPTALKKTIRYLKTYFRHTPTLEKNLMSEYVAYLEQQTLTRFSGKSPDFVDISKTKYERTPNSTKVIAWYLPQYYKMEVNDKYHGKGFTEWTNSSNTIPMFTGHYQPHIPYDVGYYDLSCVDSLKRQAELANIYGVYGFAFHWYWFSGERTMEVPPQILLNHPEIDIHYCFDWATENWTSAWDGGTNDIIFEQKLLDGDDDKFMDDLLPYFKDPRYIKINGKPVLSIYRCDMFEKKRFLQFVKNIRARAKIEGFPDLYLMITNRLDNFDVEGWGFDALAEFPPCCVYPLSNINPQMEVYKNPALKADFFDVKDFINERKFLTSYKCKNYYRSALVGFDNTSRRATTGCQIILNNTPLAFKEWLKTLFVESKAIHTQEENIVFINSWNEWAEGSHLEPDLRYGYAYLKSVKDALEESDDLHTNIIEKQVKHNKQKGLCNHFYVFCIESMGDIVASEPISRYLKQLDTNCKLTWIVKPQYKPIVEFNPNIDDIIEVECLNSGEKICSELRKKECNIIVDTHFDGRWCSKTKIQHRNNNNVIVNEKTYFYFESLLGSFCLSAGLPILNTAPRFYLNSNSKIPENIPEKYVVIHCLSAESTKDWEKQKWNELINEIIALGYAVVEVGIKPVVTVRSKFYIDKTDERDLQLIARIIEKAKCFIGIDSGFAHFANALNVPGVLIFGKYKNFDFPMSYTGNYANGINSEIIYADHDFAKTVSVENVFSAFKRVMGKMIEI